MLGRVIGSPFLTGTATNCSNRYEVSPVLATKHDFAGRMLSSGRKAGGGHDLSCLPEAGDALYAVT